MNGSSVSPDRSETTMPHPPAVACRAAASASDSVPAWLTLSSRAFAAPSRWACSTRYRFVTSRSSPTTWTAIRPVSSAKAAKSSSWNGSSKVATPQSEA
jgi:hypothetical protein